MYLPSLPDIGRDLAASTLQVQLTISTYLFGSGIGAIFYGPVSDRLGRRPVLLWALVFYAIITTGCAVAPSIWALITLRFVQGIAVAGAMALARAMVRDISSGVRAGQELSLMGSITGFAPIIAPVIGGGLQIWFGWRANFVALLLFGGVIGSVAALRLPETFRRPIKMPFSFVGMAAAYRSVTDHRGFLWHLAILTLGVAGLFAWLSGASFVMQSALYGLSPFVFGASLAVSSAGYVLGTLICCTRHGALRPGFRDWHRHRSHGAWRPVNGGRYRFGLAERPLARRHHDTLSDRAWVSAGSDQGSGADAVPRPRRHRCVGYGFDAADRCRSVGDGSRFLSRPFRLANRVRGRRDGQPSLCDLAFDAPRARQGVTAAVQPGQNKPSSRIYRPLERGVRLLQAFN
jgi:multidrug resistance protein